MKRLSKINESAFGCVLRRSNMQDQRIEDKYEFFDEFKEMMSIPTVHFEGVGDVVPYNFGSKSNGDPGIYLSTKQIVELSDFAEKHGYTFLEPRDFAFMHDECKHYEVKKNDFNGYEFVSKNNAHLYILDFGMYMNGAINTATFGGKYFYTYIGKRKTDGEIGIVSPSMGVNDLVRTNFLTMKQIMSVPCKYVVRLKKLDNKNVNESVFGKVVKRSEGTEERIEDSSILQGKLEDFVSKHERNENDYRIENKVVHCSNDVSIFYDDLIDGKFPFQFGKVDGNFICCGCDQLTSLKGCPQYVGGDFDCFNNDNITSLEGCPQRVSGNFDCSNCDKLESLNGAPQKVGGYFACSKCEKLESLEGAPQEVGGFFSCTKCKKLETLEGAPQEVGESFYCPNCENLESLEGAPQEVGESFYCSNCGKRFTRNDLPEGTKLKRNFFN